jgi:hypothetical protein
MADISAVCKSVLEDVDGGMACGVVDLNSGLSLGVHHTVPYFTQSYIDAVAAAAVDMFRGKGISGVEKLLSSVRGEEVKNSITEVQMTTKGTYHFMAVLPKKPDTLVVLVTNKKVNLGAGWAAVRKAIPDIEPLCP